VTVGPTAGQALEPRVIFSNITSSRGPKAAGGGANTYGTVPKKNMLYQQQPGLGLKRNPTQDVAENGQDTGTEMADVS
jgi:hypothetical protein